MEPKVYTVPHEIDERVARLKLDAMAIKMDHLTKEQKEYLTAWESGTT